MTQLLPAPDNLDSAGLVLTMPPAGSSLTACLQLANPCISCSQVLKVSLHCG